MDIVIHSMGMPFNGDTIKTKSLGGSESAAYYMARELASRGHRVVAYTNSPDEGIFDGVIYQYNGPCTQANPLGERFAQYACNTPSDVLIIQRHPMAFHKDYASKVNVLQLHDLALRRSAGAFNAGGARLDMVTTVSEFHQKQVEEVYGFRAGLTRVVPNGIDPELYADSFTAPGPAAEQVTAAHLDGKIAYLYQSRPERGLEHLVREGGIMDRLGTVGSAAHLFVCGYDYTTEDMRPFYEYLYARCDALPNVTFLGPLTKADLAQVQLRCDALVYPTEFEEVSCITAMEAMAAGLPFISSAHAALPETCEESGSILLPLKDGHADEDAFVETLLTFEQNVDGREAYKEAQLEAAETRTWAHAVDVLEDNLERIFKARSTSPARMARHLIEHSDIGAFDAFAEHYLRGAHGPAILDKSIAERKEMYAFAESLEATKAHYAKWEGMNCDRMAEHGLDAEREKLSVQSTTRYRGIQHLLSTAIAEKINSGLPVRVLEFGCAHGHITNLLAETFPQVQFVGMDFMQRSIDLATKTAQERGLNNIEFVVGSLDSLPNLIPFDAIIAPEVVEHIYDYMGALKALMGAVAIGGELITTTPNGRWEWSGRDWWPKGREHLHHFERQDIEELFVEFPHQILHAPGGHELAGGALGSWVYSARKVEGATLQPIDYARKLKNTVPRDTVSLCMIVKDAQVTIERALRSVVGFVDEVVIALDKTTTDKTLHRIHETVADFPHVAVKVIEFAESPMVIGFDEARNRTIDESCGDWILWMDADEEFIHPQNIWRCLRPGAFNAYSIAQHHMSLAPAQIIATDYPCRLFRRDSGARFYGVVHEHPEVEPGKAIPHSQSLPDVSIMHHGYTNEAARRGRYMRNLPLLMRDLEKHPTRTLNKFLYLRDLAQGIAFEGEQTGGVSPQMMENARKAVALYDTVLDGPMLRMALDALPYYSTAVATLMSPKSFHAKISVETKKDEFPGHRPTANVEGLFHNRETYTKLLARISQETTVNYDEKYL